MYNGPNIIKDGLVLYLDATNTKSYPRTGTTWTDLTGNGNDGTLINGPTFDSGNNGSIVFDGADDYSRINSFNSDNEDELSVFCWVYPTNLSNYQFSNYFLNWIINKRTGNTTPRDWQFNVTNSKLGVLLWDISNNSIGNNSVSNGIYTLNLNEWQYVGFVTQGIFGSYLRTYYNVQLNNEGILSGNRIKQTLNLTKKY
jgi:hypothetical protein